METTKIALFRGKKIRKSLYKNEWWFSILDIISVLTDSPQPKTYWAKMKERDKEMSQPFPFWEQLKLPAEDQKKDYEILTAEISQASFGVTPSQYKKLKGLKRENLRDHMDDFELIFTMLGERSTTEIHRQENTAGVPKLKADARRGGKIAGGARKELEKELGRSVISKKNFLKKPQNKKLLGTV